MVLNGFRGLNTNISNLNGNIDNLESSIENKGSCTFLQDIPTGAWKNVSKSGYKAYYIVWLSQTGTMIKGTYIPVDIINLHFNDAGSPVIEYQYDIAIGQWCTITYGTTDRLSIYPLNNNTAKIYGIK